MTAAMFDRSVTYLAAYTNREPSHDPEIVVALAWLEKNRRAPDEKILVLATLLEHARNSTVISAKLAGLQVVSSEGFRRGYPWSGGPALALWPNEDVMEQLDGDERVTALAAVPFDLKSVDAWVRARHPVDLLAMDG